MIKELHEKGYKAQQIAILLGLPLDQVRNEMQLLEILPHQLAKARRIKVKELVEAGLTRAEICQKLKVPCGTVAADIRGLGVFPSRSLSHNTLKIVKGILDGKTTKELVKELKCSKQLISQIKQRMREVGWCIT